MSNEKTAILAIDQGTTSSRAIAFDTDGKIVALAQKELTLHTPEPGWVEQDARDIWNDTLWAAQTALKEAAAKGYHVAGIGITNQRETTIIWDKASGEPVFNAIVWQDRRTAKYCAGLKEAGHEAMATEKTGLLLDPYFSATKIRWILENVDGVRARAEAGELLFGTVESYVLWKLTGGPDGGVHVSDITNASRTLLLNLETQDWDDDLLALFEIPRALMPEIKDNAAEFGKTAPGLLDQSYVIGGMAGDQQASLIGQGCLTPGMVKSTYGTGCFAVLNTGDAPQKSENRLLTTVGYRIDGKTTYALEGSIFVAGAAVQWLRDALGVIETAPETEKLAESVPDNRGVYFVPALTGLGAPHWAPEATGTITGLRRETGKAHIVRAALEAQAYQTLDLLEAMRADSDAVPEVIRADGGLVANEFVCQFLADILKVRVEVPAVVETTAWGAAVLAGLQCGVFGSLDEVAGQWKAARVYEPKMDEMQRNSLIDGWKDAIKRVLLT